MTTPYNEPAFPVAEHTCQSGFPGMTLRDYFATHCDTGNVDELISSVATKVLDRPCPNLQNDPAGNMRWWADYRASIRYVEADAMLAARSATGSAP